MVEQKPACSVLSQQFEFEPIKPAAAVRPAPRLRLADRKQLRLQACDLESCLPSDHSAQAIWRLLKQVDLSAYHQSIKAVEGKPGRNMTGPKILLALWLYAISEGMSSAHEVDRQCEAHDAYRWIWAASRSTIT
jgi:transposase